jgi:prepilin-type processing-associated H-X9-DG protein
VQAAREAARRAQCVNNLKQLGLAWHNYVSSNELVPPQSCDEPQNGGGANEPPWQNFSQHARLLPYLEQTALYNSINFTMGARWSGGNVQPTNPGNPPDNSSGGNWAMLQFTVLCTQINSFICPSDTFPGSSGTWTFPSGIRLVGATNYPSNFGLNRHINNWVPNGPGYVASNWDGAMKRNVGLNTFADGTSNTAIFSEWVKGPADGKPSSRNGISMVYNLGNQSADFPTDYQFAQKCATVNPIAANQNWSWKGEWWAYGGTMIYSHTIPPNRISCAYDNIGQDGRATITLINASSLHPGGVNVLFGDGSVKFVKSTVAYQAWYSIATPNYGEVVSADSF